MHTIQRQLTKTQKTMPQQSRARMGIAARIKAAAQAKNITQRQIANALNVTPRAVQKWMSVGTDSVARLAQIAHVLGCNPAHLAFGHEHSVRVN